MVVGVDDGEHLLVEGVKEALHGVHEVYFTLGVVVFQLLKQVSEHKGVLLVNDAIRALKHVVKSSLGIRQHLLEELCNSQKLSFSFRWTTPFFIDTKITHYKLLKHTIETISIH